MLQLYFFQVRIGLQQRIAELEPVSELFKVKELEDNREASMTIWSCYANLNHYHYSFLNKLILIRSINTEKFAFA